uniref:HTH_48 domain-containing protein n=1 Tax=Strongyloides papillosus TaxID=174720 RepID=A0A0N5B5G0_STREA
MLSKRDIRAIMLDEFKRGTNVAKTTQESNKTFGENLVSSSTIQRWFKKFREGSEDLENEERERPESVLDNDVLREVVEANLRTTVKELAGELNIPHELNDYQKLSRYEICSSLILRNKNDPFLDRLITCDEKWILYDIRKRSGQCLGKNEAPKQFPKPKLSPKKIMVTVWWSAIGIIHYDFMKPGETITSDFYFNRKGPILLHDNAKPHVSKRTIQKLRELEYETLPHPAYSPDLSPTDFHFFKHLNNFLTKKIFRNDEEAKTAFEAFIECRSPDFYVDGINKLVSRWQRCIDCSGFFVCNHKSNAFVERFNRTLRNAIRIRKGMSLLSVVSHFVYAYNRSKSRSTGLSPAQILLNIPDRILNDETIHNGLSGIHELIKDTKDQFNDPEQSRSGIKINVGDLILRKVMHKKDATTSMKNQPTWKGPFKIIKHLYGDTYEILRVGKRHTRLSYEKCHADRMKKYIPSLFNVRFAKQCLSQSHL